MEEQGVLETLAVDLHTMGEFWLALRELVADQTAEPLVRSSTWHHFAPFIRAGERTRLILDEVASVTDQRGREWTASVRDAVDAFESAGLAGPLEDAQSELLARKPELLTPAELGSPSAPVEFQELVRRHWAQLEAPLDGTEIRSLTNALRAAEKLGAELGYALIIHRMTGAWNEWKGRPEDYRREIRTVAAWTTDLRTAKQ